MLKPNNAKPQVLKPYDAKPQGGVHRTITTKNIKRVNPDSLLDDLQLKESAPCTILGMFEDVDHCYNIWQEMYKNSDERKLRTFLRWNKSRVCLVISWMTAPLRLTIGRSFSCLLLFQNRFLFLEDSSTSRPQALYIPSDLRTCASLWFMTQLWVLRCLSAWPGETINKLEKPLTFLHL